MTEIETFGEWVESRVRSEVVMQRNDGINGGDKMPSPDDDGKEGSPNKQGRSQRCTLLSVRDQQALFPLWLRRS